MMYSYFFLYSENYVVNQFPFSFDHKEGQKQI